MCLCAAVPLLTSSSQRRQRLPALNGLLAGVSIAPELQLPAVMHVRYGVRAHAQLLAMNLKSTLLATRAN